MEFRTGAGLNRRVVQILLQSGLVSALVLMLSGIAVNLMNGQTEIILVGLNDLFSDRVQLGNRLLCWGTFVLALTPVFRVMTLVGLWIKERDWKFVAIAIFVLMTLSVSIFSQHGE